MVTTVHIRHRGPFEHWFLVSADRHWDNPASNWEMQRRHLVQAEKRDARIIDLGDLFCAMQGKYDKRACKSALRPEHRVDDYFDALVSTAASFFERWAKRIIVLGMGNHETKILERHEINLTNNLITELNYRTGSNIMNGGYSGWVHFVFEDTKRRRTAHRKLWYIHGYGGNSSQQITRHAAYLPDADLILSGHQHEQAQKTVARVRCNHQSEVYLDEQVHAQVPSYKEEYQDGFGGWHVETGKPPKPIGALWLRFYKDAGQPIKFEITSAK